jgi:hypothetical protein
VINQRHDDEQSQVEVFFVWTMFGLLNYLTLVLVHCNLCRLSSPNVARGLTMGAQGPQTLVAIMKPIYHSGERVSESSQVRFPANQGEQDRLVYDYFV